MRSRSGWRRSRAVGNSGAIAVLVWEFGLGLSEVEEFALDGFENGVAYVGSGVEDFDADEFAAGVEFGGDVGGEFDAVGFGFGGDEEVEDVFFGEVVHLGAVVGGGVRH